MFVKRDRNGVINAISREATDGFSESLPSDSPELVSFMRTLQPEAYQVLLESDLQMARVMEDVINLLVDKSVIRFTDLPDAAQAKLLQREQIRERLHSLSFFEDDDPLGL